MLTAGLAKKLVITINEGDRWHGRSVHLALLELLQRRGIANATVTRAISGFDGAGPIRTAHLIDASLPLPLRIEAVDSPEAIERVLPDIYDIVDFGLVEVQDTQVVKFATQSPISASAARKADLVRLVGKAKMLRVHIGDNDKWEGEPLYEMIVKRARQLDIAGASVYRGILGYGAQKRVHKHHTFALSSDDPILITVIDEPEKIDQLLGALDSVVQGGCLITISDVTVVKYLEHEPAAPSVEGEAEEELS